MTTENTQHTSEERNLIFLQTRFRFHLVTVCVPSNTISKERERSRRNCKRNRGMECVSEGLFELVSPSNSLSFRLKMILVFRPLLDLQGLRLISLSLFSFFLRVPTSSCFGSKEGRTSFSLKVREKRGDSINHLLEKTTEDSGNRERGYLLCRFVLSSYSKEEGISLSVFVALFAGREKAQISIAISNKAA